MWDTLNRAIKYRPGDIVVSTYPKAGTTWTEQIVLLLLASGDESKVSSRRRHMPSFTEKYMLDPQNFFKLWFERDLGKFHQARTLFVVGCCLHSTFFIRTTSFCVTHPSRLFDFPAIF